MEHVSIRHEPHVGHELPTWDQVSEVAWLTLKLFMSRTYAGPVQRRVRGRVWLLRTLLKAAEFEVTPKRQPVTMHP